MMENLEKLKYRLKVIRVKTSRPFFNFFYQKFLFRDTSLFFKILTFSLLPFSFIYLCIVIFKRIFSHPYQVNFEVISVGNITAGGTGKTTLIMHILKKLFTTRKKIGIAISDVNMDEAEMIKENFPEIKIFRKKEIKEIIKKGKEIGVDILLIDDGFHCHWIKKDVDILLIDAFLPFDNGFLIPAGLLREPKFFIKKASAYIISHPFMEKKRKLKTLIQYLSSFKKPVFIMDYRVKYLVGKEKILPDEIRGKKIMAFCGIGNPFNFFHLLYSLSPAELFPVIFPDHFRYRKEDVREINNLFLKLNPDMVITTEKDFVKIKNYKIEIPLYYLENEILIEKLNGVDFDTILEKR